MEQRRRKSILIGKKFINLDFINLWPRSQHDPMLLSQKKSQTDQTEM